MRQGRACSCCLTHQNPFPELGDGHAAYTSAALLGQVMNTPISPGLPPG